MAGLILLGKSTLTSSSSSGIFSRSSIDALSPETDSVFDENSSQLVNNKAQLSVLSINSLRLPPPVPKRRHCSVAVGNSIPINDIVCYSKRNMKSKGVGTNCGFFAERFTESSKNNYEGVAEIASLPLPLKNFLTLPKKHFNLVNSSCQTNFANALAHVAIQTQRPSCHDKGCGNEARVEVRFYF